MTERELVEAMAEAMMFRVPREHAEQCAKAALAALRGKLPFSIERTDLPTMFAPFAAHSRYLLLPVEAQK